MMERLVPQLRFRNEYGNDFPNWKEKKLRDFCIVNPKNDELPDKFFYIDLESVNDGVLSNNIEFISKKESPSRAQRLLEKSDVLYQTVRPYQRNNYYFNPKIEAEASFVASTGYAQLRCNNNSSSFLFQLLHTDKFVSNALRLCTGTSYPAINSGDLSSIYINYPSLQEQNKIASFLSALDTRIELQEKKVENLEREKKGIMQGIFKQEIRLMDDEGKEYGEWEEKGLEELLDTNNPPENINDWYLEIGDINIQLKTYNLDKDKEIVSGAKPAREGSILISTVRPTRGAITKLQEDCYVSSALLQLYIRDIIKREFVFQSLNQERFFIDLGRLSTGSTYPTVNRGDILKYKIDVPTSMKEQQKIANFLSSLDSKIEKEKEKLELIREKKKGLMQKMFI